MAAHALGARRSPAAEVAEEVSSPPDTGALDLVVRNLGRGGIVELVVRGALDVDATEAFRSRLHTLAAKRQPATLRVDLAEATSIADGALDAVLEVAAILDGFGSQLVICNSGAAFERAVPADRLGRSLAVEGTHRDR